MERLAPISPQLKQHAYPMGANEMPRALPPPTSGLCSNEVPVWSQIGKGHMFLAPSAVS